MADYSVCGIDCDACKFKAEQNCKGCKENNGKVFWGECELFQCNHQKKQKHCGKCAQFPCDKLKEWASNENPERIDNLKHMDEYTNDLMSGYFGEKDLATRNTILKKLAVQYPEGAKDFFFKAFNKERYLDMKMIALRGYAYYATEDEVTVFTKKILELLKKRPLHTPYDYQEYEPMRSAFLLPYLIQKYRYSCFDELYEQLERQYNDMPDCFKDIYTLDDNGNAYTLRNPEEVKRSISEFFDSKK